MGKRFQRLGLFVIIQFLVPMLANFIVAIAGNLLVPFIADPREMASMEQFVSAMVGFLPIVLLGSFGFSAIVLLLYNLPMWRDALNGNGFSERSKRRVLASAFNYGVVGLGGWILSFLISGALVRIYRIDVPSGMAIFNLMTSVSSGILCMSVAFHSVEILNRRFLLPLMFDDGRISDYKPRTGTSLALRFLIYFMAVSTFPSFIFSVALFKSMHLLRRAGETPMMSDAYLSGAFLVFLSLGLFITYLLNGSLAPPLRRLRLATEQIHDGDFHVHLAIPSGDELGLLTESVNYMASGLREKDYILETFGRVVDPTIRDHLLRSGVKPGGEIRRVTIMFSDIRGFTTLSEAYPPELIVSVLNRYFQRMSQAISAHGGLVNKYIGDAIMALFNAPLDLVEHEAAALQAAQAMIRMRDELNLELEREDLFALRTGIGIHTGEVLAGNVGAQDRMEYTVIGDAVNVASRLESATRRIGEEILISAETVRGLSDQATVRHVAAIQVKGRAAPIHVYSPLFGTAKPGDDQAHVDQ